MQPKDGKTFHSSRQQADINKKTVASNLTELVGTTITLLSLFQRFVNFTVGIFCPLLLKTDLDNNYKVYHPTLYSSDDEDEEDRLNSLHRKSFADRGSVRNFHDFHSSSAALQIQDGVLSLKKLARSWGLTQIDLRAYEQGGDFYDDGDIMTLPVGGTISVTRIALFSRFLLLGIEILTNNFLGKHNNDGFRFVPEKGYGEKWLDPVVNATLRGFANWDGQYFLHIAVKGYTTENILAFFPLFPMMISFASQLFHVILGSYISLSSLVLIVSWIFNATLFTKSANLLHDLAQVSGTFPDPTPVILLFCFNPASIFFSSLYTESLFMYLTLKELMSLYYGKPYKALMWASLSTLCRSNGILNFGFVAAYFLQEAWTTTNRERRNPFFWLITKALICLIFLAPFLAFQVYALLKFCNEWDGEVPLYCRYEILPYSYIQNKYWNVGPFKYFEFKQIPNFILAAPVLYLQFNTNWKSFVPLMAKLFVYPTNVNLCGLYIAVHGVFLAVFCFVFIHVQVSTRLILSAFPYFYLNIAKSCGNEIVAFRRGIISWPIRSTFTQLWCVLYFVFGTIAFSAGLPWT
ncbi:GPI mannosyltransferase 2 isoform X2 [Folsomia candida]|uniref:GPI mannosyltransferase 2 n=1 Tax=Folsomia candida TaxID=158441 RepID=A0A226EMP9_FOLCA|nr:GPI mannosyltransferase 2 isoform X2 [Folsomia candida]OXA58407.1 GPI mannosyltransferase 2 [Folsomia candida]